MNFEAFVNDIEKNNWNVFGVEVYENGELTHSYKDTTVLVELKDAGEHIEIRIVNKGDPIPEGDEEKIFERFYRGDASRSRTDNRYGLGLAIAKSIAEKHHGGIRARSSDGSTVFEINLKKK